METSEIIANELLGKNEWSELSKRKLTIEQIREFKDKVDVFYILHYYKDLPLDLLQYLMNRQDEDMDSFDYARIANLLIKQMNATKDMYLQYIKNNSINVNELRTSTEAVHRFDITPKDFITHMKNINVGDGASVHYGSDSFPYTVIEINKTGTRMKIQSDKAIKKAGYEYYSNQEYEYERDSEGSILTIFLNKNLQWRVLGGGTPVSIGGRRRYENPSF